MTAHRSRALLAALFLAACNRSEPPPTIEPASPQAIPTASSDVETNNEAVTIATSSILDMRPRPVCVEPQGAKFRAYFGYQSGEKSTKTVSVGTYNKFTPGSSNRGQPTSFQPGIHERVFSVLWDGKPLTWAFKKGKVTASKTSPRCVQILTCNDSPDSCVLPLVRAANQRASEGDTIIDDLQVLAVTNPAVTTALCNRFNLVATRTDMGHQLLLLALIGEMRNPQAETCLTNAITNLAYPPTSAGTCMTFDQPLPPGASCPMSNQQFNMGVLHGQILSGLAYQHTANADKLLLNTISHHPNAHVRSLGARAYMWNKKNSDTARKTLLSALPLRDRDIIDMPPILQTDTGAQRDAKMAAYLKLHPEEKQTMDSVPADCGDNCLQNDAGAVDSGPPPARVCPQGQDTNDHGECVPRIVD